MNVKNYRRFSWVYLIMITALITISCNSVTKKSSFNAKTDSLQVLAKDTTPATPIEQSKNPNDLSQNSATQTKPKTEQSTVLIYNFHVTNRCVSCIAIEDATTKTLNSYFIAELKQGRIKRQILNVDDEFNRMISEKYQAFGSGLFVTRVFNGKETTTDLTGDGFKFAKNKEERFIEILKNQINEYLK
jgi:hypothetical protein